MSKKTTFQPATLGIQVAYHTVPANEAEQSVERLAMVCQIVDEDTNVVALSVYNPMGLMFLASVEQGDGPGQWNFITTN